MRNRVNMKTKNDFNKDKNMNFFKNKKIIISILLIIFVVALVSIFILFKNDGEIVGSSSDRNEVNIELNSEKTQYNSNEEYKINLSIKVGESPVTFKVLKNGEEILDGKLEKKENFEKELVQSKDKQGDYTYTVEVQPTFGQMISKDLVINVINKKVETKEETKEETSENTGNKNKTENKQETQKDKNNNDKDNSNSNSDNGSSSNNKPKGQTTWASNKQYYPGDEVVVDGQLYKCILAHKSQRDWNPSSAPTLWSKINRQ